MNRLFRTTPIRHRPTMMIAFGVFCLGLTALTGCHDDKPNSLEPLNLNDVGNARPPETAQMPKTGAEQQPGTPDTDMSATALPVPSQPAAADFHLPFYPQAQPAKGINGMPQGHRESDGLTWIVLETKDPMDKVAEFYSKAAPACSERVQQDCLTSHQSVSDGLKVVSLSMPRGANGLESVEIKSVKGMTQIFMMTMPEAQVPGPDPSKASSLALPPDYKQFLSTGKLPEPPKTTLPGTGADRLPGGAPNLGGPLHPAPILPPSHGSAGSQPTFTGEIR